MRTLADFNQESKVFEIRFAPAFAIWDRAGRIWARVCEAFPKLENRDVVPNQQNFETDKLRATMELHALRVTSRGADSEEFHELSELLCDTVTEELQIRLLTRIGYRRIWSQHFETKQGAFSAALPFASAHLMNIPPKGLDPVAATSSVTFEHEGIGMLIAARTETRTPTLAMAIEWREFVTVTFPPPEVFVLDCDYFTTAPTNRDSLEPTAWIKSADRTMKRTLEAYL